MWFWCNAPFTWMWWIFPIMFLVCLVMMFFYMRMFFGGHFGHHFRCCSPGRPAGERPNQHRETDHAREER
jgi:hypothetical protein